MLDRIHTFPELTGLLTREKDDHAITVLELFAALGDVLTFYNERIANEMFLRQALHKASVEQLTALVGYLPRPALSATAALAFEIQEGKATQLWQGLKVMSVPGPDEIAQIFETLEEVRANGRLNAIPVMAPFARFNAFARARARAPLASLPALATGDRFVLFGGDLIEEKEATKLETGPRGTYLSWAPPVQAPGLDTIFVRAVAVRRRLRFFGHDAPEEYTAYNADPTVPPQDRWGPQPISGALGDASGDYPLDRRFDDLTPGAHLLLDAGPDTPPDKPRLRTGRVISVNEGVARLPDPPIGNRPPAVSDTVTRIRVLQTIQGRPSLAEVPGANPIALFRTGGGTPAMLVADDTSHEFFAAGEPLPHLSSDLAAVVDGTALHTFARGRGGGLMYNVGFSAWTDLGGLLTSPPAPVALAGGQVLVFVRGAEAALWMYNVTGGPALPVTLGGVLASPPAVVTPDGVHVAAFTRGIDDALWWRLFDGVAWADWENLGGTIVGTPAAAVNGTGRIDVFARGRDGGVVHFRQNPTGWEPPRDLGGDPAGDPAAVAGAPDWALAAVRTGNGTLAFINRSTDTWSHWHDQGGTLASDPSLAVAPSGIGAAARHADGTLTTALLKLPLPTWIRNGDGFGNIPDRRKARLYELAGEDIAFRDYDYPATLSGGWLSLPMRPGESAVDPEGLGALSKGRKIVLSDGSMQHRAKVTRTFAIPTALGGPLDHLAVGIAPPLPPTSRQVTLLGNVAEASHGETQREDVLGNGNASESFQAFKVPPGEISHLPQATGVQPVPQVELRVEQVVWREVPHLYGRGRKQRVYTLRLPSDADPVVRGGDGLRAGARFPTGALNVRMTRRLGAGLAGNLKSGQLSVALEKPVGLKAVNNPLPASGGAPGETADDARDAAPDRMRTFGRIVSLQDFTALAKASGLAAKSDEAWVWNRMERTVHLTVAGPGGSALPPETLALLHDMLTASRDPNRPLMLANMVRVPIVLSAKLLRDPTYEADAVAEAARAVALAAFAFEAVGIGRPVHVSDAFAVLQSVAGVAAVDIDLLHLRDHADLSAAERKVRSVTADPVQPHIRLYRARPTPTDPAKIDRYQAAAFETNLPPVLPAEQAYFGDPATDLQLTVVEAL